MIPDTHPGFSTYRHFACSIESKISIDGHQARYLCSYREERGRIEISLFTFVFIRLGASTGFAPGSHARSQVGGRGHIWLYSLSPYSRNFTVWNQGYFCDE